MRLESNCEIVGTLSEIKIEGGHVKLAFAVAREIELTSNAFSYEQLKAVLGKSISILNMDGKFFVREIKGRCRV